MTLEAQISLINELIARNPDATVKDFAQLMMNKEQAREMLIRNAQVKLNRIFEERYRNFNPALQTLPKRFVDE